MIVAVRARVSAGRGLINGRSRDRNTALRLGNLLARDTDLVLSLAAMLVVQHAKIALRAPRTPRFAKKCIVYTI